MSGHSFLAPSGAHIWGPDGCPYYPTMAASTPQEESEATREGTEAHGYLAAMLDPHQHAAPEDAPSTEMGEAAVLGFNAVLQARASAGGQGHVETRVDMHQVHPTQCWGTADWFDLDEKTSTVYVVDFKYGHRYVDPYENPQLVLYGLGALNFFGVVLDTSWSFVFTIVQPRAYHADGPVKTWRCDGARFLQLVEALRQAADEATGFEPAMRTGEHCNDCEGRATCPAFQQVAGAALDVSRTSTPQEMSPEAIGTMRTYLASAIKRLEGMATGLDAAIERAARSGASVPGWELKPKDTRLDWSVDLAEVALLGDLYGIQLSKPAAITPTQAIKAGVDEAVILAYASRPPGGFKVAPSDKTTAAKAFK